jgi:hypothetical protein
MSYIKKMKMKTKLNTVLRRVVFLTLVIAPVICNGQNEKRLAAKYLKALPAVSVKKNNGLQKYRMTAVYTNRDLYGNFTSKTKVTGDYTKGLNGDSAMWNNVYISGSNKPDETFPLGTKQLYMENFRYIPSSKMLQEQAFKKFPNNTENVFARNLIWDMMAIEEFGWNYWDSLKLNTPYIIPDIKGEFKMSDIGNYNHNRIELCWKGISMLNGGLFAIIDFMADDNKIEILMDQIKTKGTEQYWGTVLVSLKTKNIGQAVMFGGTIQEIEVKGLKDKFLIKTIRELKVDKIQ